MARIPGMDAAFALLQAQTEAVLSLTRAVAGLGDTVVQAREAIASVQRLTARMDGIVAELEEPLRDLAPGLRRLAVVLEDDAVSDLPATLRTVRKDVLPVLRTVADTHDQVERLIGLVDGLPGVGLFGRRRTAVVVEQDPPRRG